MSVIDKQPTGQTQVESGGQGSLSALAQLSSATIKEEREIEECLFGDKVPCGPWGLCCGPPKKHYSLSANATSENKLILLSEESDLIPRRCFTRMRGFTVKALEASSQQEMFRVVRTFDLVPCVASTLCPCGFYGWFHSPFTDGFQVRIERPDGNVIGYVEQKETCLKYEFHLLNNQREAIYKFEADHTGGPFENPCWIFPIAIPSCIRWLVGHKDITANLKTMDGTQVGSISWQFPGVQEACLLARHQFKINFPNNADANAKAIIVGANVLLENFFGPYSSIYGCLI